MYEEIWLAWGAIAEEYKRQIKEKIIQELLDIDYTYEEALDYIYELGL